MVQGDGTPGIDRTSAIAYNAAGFIDNITDPLSRTVSFQYDAVGRVIKQVLPDLREINFTYDANGNVASITPPGRPNHAFDYNAVDLENEYTPPNVTPPLADPRTFFTYNLDKQLTSITRPDGQVITMGYDPGGRLSAVTLPENPPGTAQVYNYAYDAVTGNLSTITAPDAGNLTFTYDGSLLLNTSWTGTVPGSVSRTYDNDFRITSRSINGANTIAFGYDADSLLTSAGNEALSYDLTNGLLTGTTLGSVTDSYSYSGFGEVSNYNADANAASVFSTGFTRDKLGRITQKTENIQGVAHTFDYTYNDAGYLVEVKRDSVVTATYTYDLNGNRQNDGAVYDNQDRLTSTSTTSYTYTDNGELLTKTEGAQITQYKYDVLGTLLSVTLPSGTLIEYVIDANNRRVGKKVDGVLQKAWLYMDGLNPIAELDGAGNVVSRFVYASRANIPDYVIKGGVTYRIISDHLGSPRLVIDSVMGTVVQAIEYNEWGNFLSDTNPGFLPFAFAGGLYDADTKLLRFGARDYDPETGRWTVKDPVRFDGDGPNLYGYALNDPVNIFDPLGLWSKQVHDYILRRYGIRHNLTESQIQDMQRGSTQADSFLAGNQGSDKSYIHAMTSEDFRTQAEACKLSNQFIKQNLGQYNGLLSGEISPKVGGHRGRQLKNTLHNPYFRLGMAMHTVMDSTSPAHVGFQQWEWSKNVVLRHWGKDSIENIAALVGNQHLIDETLDLMDSVMSGGRLDCSCYQ